MSGEETNGRSQSLYRKYRPTTFGEDEFVGQNHVSRTLRNAVRFNRVAHAYLFCGPRGSGKTSSARLLAKAVNCEAAEPDQRPCNECASCRAINEGRATDIIEIDAASNRGIDDMRDLREKVKIAPAQLRKKFYIIDEVHQLTKEASNALLKTLEEPPAHAVFILATTDQEKVLDTISSRCQTFVFHRFPVDLIANHLRRICTNEQIAADDAALLAIAHASGGAMRDALGLLDQLSSYGDSAEGITVETVRQILGAGGGEQVRALVDAIMVGDAAAGLRAINLTIDDGADARQFSAQIVEYLRALLHSAANPQQAPTNPNDTAVEPAHLAGFTLGEIASLVKRFSQVDYGLRHSTHGHLPLELCLIDAILARTGEQSAPQTEQPAAPRVLPNRPPTRSSREAAPTEAAAPARQPTPIRPDPVPAPAPVPAETPPVASAPATPPAEPKPVVVAEPITAAPVAEAVDTPPAASSAADADLPDIPLERLHDLWPQIRQGVRAANRRIEALLASTDPFEVSNGTLTLVAAYDFHRNGLNKDDAKQIIEEVLAQVLQGPYRLACITQGEAAERPAPAVASKPPTPITTAATAPSTPPTEPAGEPPWDPEPATAPRQGKEQAPSTEPAAAPEPPRTELSAAHSEPTGVVDERYYTALRNIFSAVEIQPNGQRANIPRWED